MVVGLTGGICSGKTTVAGMLKDLGAVIISADEIAKEVIKPETPQWKKLREYFGSDILNSDRSINRRKLADIIFTNSEARKVVNKITHPEIIRRIKKEVKKVKKEKVVIVEAPLLIEANATDIVDKIIVVYAERSTQIKRLVERYNISYRDAVGRLNSQIPLKDKLKYADWIIDTNCSLKETEAQVRELWENLKRGTEII